MIAIKQIFCSLLTCIIYSVSIGQAFADSAIPNYGSPELQPIHYADQEGQPVGYWVDIINEMNAFLDTEFTMELKDVRIARNALLENPEPALLGVVLEASQLLPGYEHFTFSESFGSFNLRFYTIGNEALLLNGFTNFPESAAVIGAPGAFAIKWLEQNSPQTEIRTVESFEEGIQLVSNGMSEAFFGSEWAVRYAFSENIDEYSGLVEGPIVFSSNMTFAALNEYSYLIDQVNTFQAHAVSSEILQRIYLDWVSQPPLTPEQWSQIKYKELVNQRIILFLTLILLVMFFAAYVINSRSKSDAKLKELQRMSLMKINHDIRAHLDILKKQISKEVLDSNNFDNTQAEKQIDVISELLIPIGHEKITYTNMAQKDFEEEISRICGSYNIHPNIFLEDGAFPFYINNNILKYSIHSIVRNIKQHSSSNEINISISYSAKKRDLILSISHLGNPLPDNVIKYINSPNISIEPPYQSKTSTGIGLHLLKSIFLRDNWVLKIICGSGKNTFRIEIPPVEKSVKSVVSKEGNKILITNGEKVLIVDDDIFSRELSATQLNRYGIEVFHASDSNEAIRLIKSEKTFNLIILDVNLGFSSGIDLAQILVNDIGFPPSRIIIVSGEILDSKQSAVLRSLGIQTIILKPASILDYLQFNIR
ncbi:response regulator [Roseobacter sp. HKCCA2468]|uniref:response regulator n=1 Tax=Roseobacter sp. HKCCA2468 TaxID=3120342 RepID=UPI0030EF3267